MELSTPFIDIYPVIRQRYRVTASRAWVLSKLTLNSALCLTPPIDVYSGNIN